MLQKLFSQDQWALVFLFDSIRFIIVFFHFKNESTDLIYWYTFSFSTAQTYAMLNRLFTRILANICISM